MRIVAAVVLAIGVLAVFATANERGAASSHDATLLRGAIAFYGGPRFGLYAIDATGGPPRQLALGFIDGVHWAPDGREIGFEQLPLSDRPTPPGLYVMVQQGQVRRLLALTKFAPYSWSPDGRTIAYSEGGAIWVIPSVGGRKKRLTSQGGDSAPLWSPDGGTIVFTHAGMSRRPSELFTMKPDGTHRRHLADGASPDWSPDGRRLVYVGSGRSGVFVINADGTARHRILGRGNVVTFAWAPDGNWIAFTGSVGKKAGTFRVRPDGSGFRQISAAGESLRQPSWSPDSRWVVVEDACCRPDDWIVAADGSSQRRLTEGWRYGYGNYEPEWNPRGVPAARFAGTDVPPSLPTDSVADASTLRTTHPVTRLVADGPAVAVRHDKGYGTCAEVWTPTVPSLTTFPNCLTPTGFGFAGDRVVWSHGEAGGGTTSWTVGTGTTDIPNFESVKGAADFGEPTSDIVGEGPLIAFDSWGPCPRDTPVCTPKTKGKLYRLDGTQAVEIATSPGALTPLAVDNGRILVDHENGTLELMRPEGKSLQTFHVYLGDFLGAKLQGRDVVVLKHDTIADYDADIGLLLHEWTFAASADRQLADIQDGIAVCVSGTQIHLLRLSDGHEAIIDAPGAGPVLAQLEPSGLFYSYTASDPKYPGRVVFVPFDQLPVH